MYWNVNGSVLPTSCTVLNSNIRCIEISDIFDIKQSEMPLNSNIRCIEIAIRSGKTVIGNSWIVTLDVLKYYKG